MLRRSFLASLAVSPAWRLSAQPAPHPRLFFDSTRLQQMRVQIESTHADIWRLVKLQADAFVRSGPPAYTQPTTANDEQLWQREVGNKLPFLAIAFALTQNPTYLDSVTRWSLSSCGYPHWGAGTEDGNDLAAGHQLFGLAMVYDWLYDSLAADTRTMIGHTLLERGRVMYNAAVKTAYWRNSYLQNHLWVSVTGLLAAALALDGESSTADWVNLVRDKFRATEAALGPDGASHEGAGYWEYGVEYMLKYWHLAGDLLGDNLASPWWQNTAAYRCYLSVPRSAWTSASTIADIADCPRGDWYGPEYLLRRLAALYRDPQAQWFAAEMERAGVTQYAAKWLNLVWYDPTLEAEPPATAWPTLRHFDDMGIVAARSDWSGDESLVIFKCGPPIGHAATDQFSYDPGSGHVHPDANHFVVFGAGEWLLKDEGYAWKQTDHHNTLLVDGKGQMGDGSQWFGGLDPIRRQAHPRVLRTESTADVDDIMGDAAAIYRPETGVRRFVRRLLFLKPDVLIVIDDIAADQARRLELRFHPEYRCEAAGDGAFLARGKKAVLRLDPLTPEGVQVTAGDTPGKDRDGNPMTLYALRLERQDAGWKNAVSLSWAAANALPVRVTLERQEERWTFRAGERSVTISL